MSASDYSNRRIDVLALRGVLGDDSTAAVQSLFDDMSSGEVCTGIQKLAQRWTLEFMTIRGSMPYLPTRGTDFISAARRGAMHTEADIIIEFQFAAEEARQNLVVEEYVGMPDDERFAGASLDTVLLTEAGDVAIGVTVSSQAGDTRSVIVPLAVSTLAPVF